MNDNLNAAKSNRYDEFYTMRQDVADEIEHYSLNGKRVYCNCDSADSAFVKYLTDNFDRLGLRLLVATAYNGNGNGSIYVYNGLYTINDKLNGNGDFRSDECVGILGYCDVVITNPPFSLFREFVSLMDEYEKDYLIIGLECACNYKEFFKDIRDGKVFVGHKLVKGFISPDGKVVKFGNICWWTNIYCADNIKFIPSSDRYSNEDIFDVLDNYDAIMVDRVVDIPRDYDGVMAVPLTYIKYHNPNEYEIVGITSSSVDNAGEYHYVGTSTAPYLNGKKRFARVLIKKKNNEKVKCADRHSA